MRSQWGTGKGRAEINVYLVQHPDFAASPVWGRSHLEVTIVVEVSLTGSNEGLGLGLGLQVDRGLGRQQSGLLNERQLVILAQLTEKVDEGLLIVVVGLDGNFVVGQRLTAVIGDLLRGNVTLSHVDLVTAQDNRNVGAHTANISVPVGHVSVGKTSSHVEHDDGGLTSNVIALAQPYVRSKS